MSYTFIGGTHIAEHKETNKLPIETVEAPEFVAIPLKQHIGAPCTALVSKGDEVSVGQIIGDNKQALCCPVHASISGTVKEIQSRQDYSGGTVDHIIIQNDYKNTVCSSVKPVEKTLDELSSDEIIELVRNAGIVGMGGAAFPTYAKIQSAVGKARKLIVNCAECEPYITGNHRLLFEHPQDVINGIKILIKATGTTGAIIAIEDNKLDAAEMLDKHITDKKLIQIKILKTKYPQGDERQLIYALFDGLELPQGKLPADVGCVIFNPETAYNVFISLSTGMPVVSKILTVSGDAVNDKKNLLVPVGISYNDVFRYCGGLKPSCRKIVSGGPMMGVSQWNIEASVTRSTGALLAFSETYGEIGNCIRCGRCVRACQMRLMPIYLAAYSEAEEFDECERFGAMSCVECGCCTYVCPGKVPIVQYIRNAKGVITERRKRLSKK